MSYKAFDIVVVGQGIAGTLMAYFLKKHGLQVLVMDNNFEGASSKVAAGIVNPITGKNFVKSWRVDEFLPFAEEVYTQMGNELGIQPYTKANIIRSLDTIQDENNWLARTSDSSVAQYMVSEADVSEFLGKVNQSFGYGEITGTYHVHLSEILEAFKKKCIEEESYLQTKFDYNGLKVDESGFYYDNYCFSEIVFCEGYQALYNPFFPNIGMAPSKGEVLLVKIPQASFRKMYKNKIFIVHHYDDVYWVGSGYEWNAPDDKPTPKSYAILSEALSKALTIPYQIIDHLAAIRPTMHTRRPVFKIHEEIKGMYLFNGLGTKGSSIGPLAARQFARYIVERNPNDLEL